MFAGGDRNRSVLVRVPLGWSGKNMMAIDANPKRKVLYPILLQSKPLNCEALMVRRMYICFSGWFMAVAARHGLEMKDALDYAKKNVCGC